MVMVMKRHGTQSNGVACDCVFTVIVFEQPVYIRLRLYRQYLLVGSMYCWFWYFHCLLIFPFFICPGKPTCRCPVGFSGPFCEKRICDNYCLNGGTCDVTQGNQPVCRCMAEYTGDRCLYRESCTYYLVAANTINDYYHVLDLHIIDISLSA